MSMEQRQEQRERRRATNNQCSGIEREQRLIRRRDFDRLRERENNEDAQERLAFTEKEKIMKVHRKGWLLQNMSSYS